MAYLGGEIVRTLGVRSVCRSTVINLLKEQGLELGPKRGQGSWDEFIKQHATTLWACDFFSKKVWTARGLVEVFVLFFLHVGSRRVFVSGMSAHPDRKWLAQQARNVVMHFAERPEKPTYLLRDNDGKFGPEFDTILESEGVTVKKLVPVSPNLNAYAERWVQSVKQECLDHFLVFGKEHLRYFVSEYVAHYNQERPHQARDNLPQTVDRVPAVKPLSAEELLCREWLGDLLKHYHRAG